VVHKTEAVIKKKNKTGGLHFAIIEGGEQIQIISLANPTVLTIGSVSGLCYLIRDRMRRPPLKLYQLGFDNIAEL